jgi:hypothetical protein
MFKKITFLLLISTIYCHGQDQVASVEKSVFGVHTGLVGFWANHELRLSNRWALRTELGSELYVVTSSNGDTESLLVPVISSEPKWYYNLNKRYRKGRNIKGNSGNAFSLKLQYNPHFILAGEDFVRKPNHLSFLAKWGIRRVYWTHFTFETGLAIGPTFYLANDNLYKKSETFLDLNLRIGYTF